ncbi:DNA glycosylase, partial [Ascodesmis nigricans]
DTSRSPPNWEEMYDLVLQNRRSIPAPVDTMGCASLHDPNAPEIDQRFHTLVSLMLSSQTKDTITAPTVRNLQTTLPGGLTVASILATPPQILNNLISKVGFHKRKTEYILATAKILREEYNGDIPDTLEGLMKLPGVGPKMAHLCMTAAWGKTMGIGVDVHVHRICNLWGWVKNTKTPEDTRIQLEKWLPREKWAEINWLLVGFGQTVCLPRGRKCGECPLSNGLCRAAFK